MRRLLVLAALLTVGSPLALNAAAPASATGPAAVSFVTMYSDPGDFIGGGDHRLYTTTEGDTVVGGGPATGSVDVTVSGGRLGDSFNLEFAAPPGQTLHSGLYTGVQRLTSRTAGHAGMDIWGDGRGCNAISGRFDVRSIATDSSGNVTQLWLTYEQHCEEGPTALFGEVRINAAPQASLQQVPGTVWWPDVPLGAGSQTIPATFFATGTSPVTVSSAKLVGSDASQFVLKEDDCTGVTLAPGDSCEVWLRFVPLLKGPRIANLDLTTSTGLVRAVLLDGFGIGGHTELTMKSDPGDWVGQGQTYDFTPANGTIAATGSHSLLQAGRGSWALDFAAPSGDIFTAGTTYDAARYPLQGSSAGMSITGNGNGCNTVTGTFTVNSISFAPDDSLQSASISFVQHCEGATPALRGTFYWRVPTGNNVPPSPVSSLRARRGGNGSTATVSWTITSPWSPTPGHNPIGTYTIVRCLFATQAPGSPNGSLLVYDGPGTTVTLPAPHTQPLSCAVYRVDTSGNVSAAQTVTLAAS